MPTTRSSARKTSGSSPITATTGNKRKANESPASSPSGKGKKGRNVAPKKQKTIEETIPDTKDENKEPTDTDMKDAEPEKAGPEAPKPEKADSEKEKLENHETDKQETKEKPTANGHKSESSEVTEVTKEENHEESSKDESKSTEEKVEEPKAKIEDSKTANGDAVTESKEREKSTPSAILEKGIIYFFFRGRIGIDEPSDVNEVARSYIVLRPLPRGAKLEDGPIGEHGNNRVIALPKKVLPRGPKDRFMAFVEKSKVTIEDIKKDFLSASDYETKTAGTRHSPAATPIGEGVYAITSTGRESNLAYILSIPSELGEVQKDVGLEQKGSFVTSVRNPQYEAPPQARLPEGPKFSQE
jgi:chemotaxis protein histidine kinase CheA